MIKFKLVHGVGFDAFAIVLVFGATTRVEKVLNVAHSPAVSASVVVS